jgi:hypothetical protein
MELSKIQQAVRGDLTKLERYRLRPSTPTTPAQLTDTHGGRPPNAIPSPAAQGGMIAPRADPRQMNLIAQMMIQGNNKAFWETIVADPTADDTTKLLASLADITEFAARRQAREETSWAPEGEL